MNEWKPYLGRLIFTALGFIAAILFIVIGFGKTILIIFCCTIGYLIGVYHDKGLKLPEWVYSWRNRW